MKYTVASEGHARLRSKGIRVGRRVASPSIYVPGGMLHAVQDNVQITVCGIALANLWEFPNLDFADRATPKQCPACRQQTM